MKTAGKKVKALGAKKNPSLEAFAPFPKIDYLNNPLFGLWKDRKDIKDSAEFVRKLRKSRVKRLYGAR